MDILPFKCGRIYFGSNKNEGFSKGLFKGMNVSPFVGDNEDDVRANIEKARELLHADKLILLNQVHGNEVLYAKEDTEMYQKYDALITDIPGIAIGVMTADCAPIIFIDMEANIVGVAHAGWRGAASGIIENTIKRMRQLGSVQIMAVIGPCIHEDNYVVDEEFKNNFAGKNTEHCFYEIDGQLHFSLPIYCYNVLTDEGVDAQICRNDTYNERDKYFSYRRAKEETNGVCGRNLTAICLKKTKY